MSFLKTDATEFSHVQSYINRVILARPDVSFTLIHNDKTIIQNKGIKDNPELALKNAIASIYGNIYVSSKYIFIFVLSKKRR